MSDANIFQWPIRVYWEDTDAGGIVFYANYLKYFERARTEWLRSLGIGQRSLKDTTGGMFVVSETTLRYLRPARLDSRLAVTAQLTAKGRASLTLQQQALLISEQGNEDSRGLPPILLCEGSIRIGWVDAQTLQPARIPNNILEALP